MNAPNAQDPLGRARAALTGPGAYFEIESAEVRGAVVPVFRHRARSLRALLETSAQFAYRTYLVEGEFRLTFGEHLAMVDRLAAHLQRTYGLRPGDRVAICAANRWEWVVAFWAVTTAGALPCAFNGHWTSDEIAHAISLVEPRLIIVDAKRAARVAESGASSPVLDLEDVRGLAVASTVAGPTPVEVDENDPALLIFTSGTTGALAPSRRPIAASAASCRSARSRSRQRGSPWAPRRRRPETRSRQATTSSSSPRLCSTCPCCTAS